MKIWFDTEFIDDGKTIDLISIGMIREDEKTLYFENEDCKLEKASDWVQSNVIPKLTSHFREPRERIAEKIIQFAGWKPEFWAYYGAYDWVALCQLYGSMIDLPRGWPMLCLDTKQLSILMGIPRLPIQPEDDAHNALVDAKWTREAYLFLESHR